MSPSSRRIPLEGAFNFRDLGGFSTASGKTVVSRRVFRSDALHRLSPCDVDLLEGFGIERVLDLRSEAELRKDGLGSFAGRRARHVHIPLVDVTLSPFDTQINWQQINLQGRYVEMLQQGGSAIRTVLETVAADKAGAVVFHCTGGKDRTGVVAAVLLRALGVADDEIVADYAASQGHLRSFLDGYRDAMIELGMDQAAIDYLTSSPPERMRHTLTEMDRIWGSTGAYLASIGVGREMLRSLRRNLLR